ncbi:MULTISPECIES: hypothetical protein [unclassified Streptomyces]|uniref:hypothetical protein n=1 Tax=Streptomyces sp. NPDC055082 TaxID=3365718 RepID=UPI0037D78A66
MAPDDELLSHEEWQTLLRSLREWVANPNITLVRSGIKETGGKATGRPAVVVHVERKKQPHELAPTDFLLPPTVTHHRPRPDGGPEAVRVDIDVIETGPLRIQALDGQPRPVPGGYQITVRMNDHAVKFGTLGAYLNYGGRMLGLAANHMVSANGRFSDKEVYQPSELEQNALIGHVTGYHPVPTIEDLDEEDPDPDWSTTDYAWITMTDEHVASPQIALTGVTPVGIGAPAVGQKVTVVGAATGVIREAEITQLDGASGLLRWVNLGEGEDEDHWLYAQFEGLIVVKPAIGNAGDCGAVYVNENHEIVGMHFASDNMYSYATRIPPFPPPLRPNA